MNKSANGQTFLLPKKPSPVNANANTYTGSGSTVPLKVVNKNLWKLYVDFLQNVDLDDEVQMRNARNVIRAKWRDAITVLTKDDSLGSVPLIFWVAHFNMESFPERAWGLMFELLSKEQIEKLYTQHLDNLTVAALTKTLAHSYRSHKLSHEQKTSLLMPVAFTTITDTYFAWKTNTILGTRALESCISNLSIFLVIENCLILDHFQEMEYNWWSFLYCFSESYKARVLDVLPERHATEFLEEYLTGVTEAQAKKIVASVQKRNDYYAGVPVEWILAQYYRKDWLEA